MKDLPISPKQGKLSKRAPRLDAATDDAGCDELPTFQLSGHPLRILRVDDMLPSHTALKSGRPRMTYVPGEIVHFEVGGHRYALAGEPGPAAQLDSAQTAAAVDDPADVIALLTNRELQIVQLICMGYYTKQVAGRLKLSEFTVKSYLKTVYCKLRVRSRGAMVYRYAQTFLGTHPPPSSQSE